MSYPAQAQTPQPRIDVVVVSGEGAVNSLRQRVSQDPAVQIVDQDQKPVTGAVVTFNLPISGTTGEFENGARSVNVVTGGDGIAAAKGLRTNDVPGRLQILVTASYRGLTARGLINQTNQGTPAKAHSSGKIAIILAVVGAAAAGGAFAATRGKGSSSSGSPSGPSGPAAIGITPGTGTITHP